MPKITLTNGKSFDAQPGQTLLAVGLTLGAKDPGAPAHFIAAGLPERKFQSDAFVSSEDVA